MLLPILAAISDFPSQLIVPKGFPRNKGSLEVPQNLGGKKDRKRLVTKIEPRLMTSSDLYSVTLQDFLGIMSCRKASFIYIIFAEIIFYKL